MTAPLVRSLCAGIFFGALASVTSLQAADAPLTVWFPAPCSAEQRIEQALDQRTDFQFNDTPIADALDFLRDYHQITIWIDKVALQDEGIDPVNPVTLELAGITLRSGLRLLLESNGLTFIVEDEVLKITTRAAAMTRQHTRVYPVPDLAATPEELKSLVEAIEVGAVGLKWSHTHSSKIDGGIIPVVSTRSLVIRQTYAGHQQVVELLSSLRAAQQTTHEKPTNQSAKKKRARVRGK